MYVNTYTYIYIYLYIYIYCGGSELLPTCVVTAVAVACALLEKARGLLGAVTAHELMWCKCYVRVCGWQVPTRSPTAAPTPVSVIQYLSDRTLFLMHRACWEMGTWSKHVVIGTMANFALQKCLPCLLRRRCRGPAHSCVIAHVFAYVCAVMYECCLFMCTHTCIHLCVHIYVYVCI